MADIVTRQKRSEMMRGIKGRDTRPEIAIRKALHALGFRYRLHDQKIPGRPDLIFPKHKAVIFVHGCFWHRHDCHLFKWPQTRQEFWQTKITGNAARDKIILARLKAENWRVLTIWECALKGKCRLENEGLFRRIAHWLESDNNRADIRGRSAQK